MEEYLQDKYSKQEAIQILTDRTRQKKGIVAAIYIQTYPKSRERGYYLGKKKKIFDIECQELKKEVEHLERKRTTNKKIIFEVDSQAAILRIQIRIYKPVQLSVIAFRTAVETFQLKRYKIEVLQTLSYVGITGNKKVEKVAKQVAESVKNIRKGSKQIQSDT